MTYQQERDEFIARMTREGLPIDVTRLLLREATGLNRRAELACSSEAADRDRVPCPATRKPIGPCLCDRPVQSLDATVNKASHQDITRITLLDWRAEERIRKAFDRVNAPHPDTSRHKQTPCGLWSFQTEGDPRGYVLRVIPPSYAERNAGKDRFNRDAIGVPNGPSRIRW